MECPMCKSDIRNFSDASRVPLGLGLELVFHNKCLSDLESKMHPAPTVQKADCKKGECIAQMSKRYPGFIQVGDHTYSPDKFKEEFGDMYDIRIEGGR